MRRIEDYDEDPEFGDEDDPEYIEEIWEGMFAIGTKPEDLPDAEDRKAYAEWLDKRPSASE